MNFRHVVMYSLVLFVCWCTRKNGTAWRENGGRTNPL